MSTHVIVNYDKPDWTVIHALTCKHVEKWANRVPPKHPNDGKWIEFSSLATAENWITDMGITKWKCCADCAPDKARIG